MNRSFTLLEVLVAIFIFTVGIVGIWLLIQQPLVYSKNFSHQLIAVYLAQEGIEIVKNIRDSNLLKKCYVTTTIPWNEGLGDGNYEADYTSDQLNSWQGKYLKINSEGFYQYSDGDQTQFKRKITLQSLDIDSSILTTVQILFGTEERELFSLQTKIYDLFESLKDMALTTGGCLED